jgi:iron complex transport system substrate-binding protein
MHREMMNTKEAGEYQDFCERRVFTSIRSKKILFTRVKGKVNFPCLWGIVFLTVVLPSLLVCVCSTKMAAGEIRTVVDQVGRKVTIPAIINKVAVPLPWMLNIVTAIGARDKVAGVSTYAVRDMGFNILFPEWVKSQTIIGDLNQMNKEVILRVNPDLMIAQPGPSVKQMEEIGIPTVVVTRELDTTENIRFIGMVLGKEREAEKLASFYEKTMGIASSRTSGISENARKKVYYTSGPDALKVAGKNFGNAPLVRKAGGVLVTENLSGGSGTAVSMEQVLQWDPDIVVVGYGYGLKPADILSDPKWQHIKAVKNHSVYLEPPPHAACIKKHPSAALGVLWLAQKAYPDRFKDVNVQKMVEDFIQRFYGVTWKANFE